MNLNEFWGTRECKYRNAAKFRGNSGNIRFHLRCYRVFEVRDFADDDTLWIRIHGLIIRRWLIFQIIRNKPVTARSRNPRVIAVAVIVDANTLSLSLSLFTSVSTPRFPSGFPPHFPSVGPWFDSVACRGRKREEIELSAACTRRPPCLPCPLCPWIMQARCNWSPNRNGLLFTFLHS